MNLIHLKTIPATVVALSLSLGSIVANPSAETSPPVSEKAKKVTPSTPPAAMQAAKKGMAAFSDGDFETAAAAFKEMYTLAPEHPMARVNLASALYRLGRLDEAEFYLSAALVKAPTNVSIMITLGIIYVDLNKPNSALAVLARAVELEPDNPRAHSYLGVTCSALGWNYGAESEFRKAIELNAKYTDAHYNLALIYLRRTPPALELARRHYHAAVDLGAKPDPIIEKQLAVATQ